MPSLERAFNWNVIIDVVFHTYDIDISIAVNGYTVHTVSVTIARAACL